MRVITFCNHKGGTGKTTSTIHVAAALGLSGYRTLVVDLDPQGFLSQTMGVDPDNRPDTVLSLFEPDASLWECPVRSMSGFDLIPSSARMTRRMRDLNKPTDALWLREAMGARDEAPYDMVLFDTAAAVTVFSLNALVASDHSVIPVLPEPQAVVGAEQTFQTVSMIRKSLNPALYPPIFLFTQVHKQKRVHRAYRHYIRKKYSHRVLNTYIGTSTSLTEPCDDGETVFDVDPYSRGAKSYANATDELLERMDDLEDEDALPDTEIMAPPSSTQAPSVS